MMSFEMQKIDQKHTMQAEMGLLADTLSHLYTKHGLCICHIYTAALYVCKNDYFDYH